MTSELKRALHSRDEKAARAATRSLRATGTPTLELAQVICEEAEERLLAGDTQGADAVLFHAVHDGVPAHELFLAAKAVERKGKK